MLETIPMNDKSDAWRAEIEDLSNENSARILSIVLGVSVGEAADRILEHEPRVIGSRTGFTQAVTLARILETELHTASRISTYRTGISSGVQFTDSFLTINQWLEANPRRLAILRAKQHFVYVGFGMVLSTSSHLPKHSRVTHVIYLDEE